MIESICHMIIKDLGPTGVLILALAYIQYRSTKKIVNKLTFINHELGDILEAILGKKLKHHNPDENNG